MAQFNDGENAPGKRHIEQCQGIGYTIWWSQGLRPDRPPQDPGCAGSKPLHQDLVRETASEAHAKQTGRGGRQSRGTVTAHGAGRNRPEAHATAAGGCGLSARPAVEMLGATAWAALPPDTGTGERRSGTSLQDASPRRGARRSPVSRWGAAASQRRRELTSRGSGE